MKLNIGIIGAGKIARVRHIPETASNPNAQVSAICDIDEARADEMAQEYHCKAYTNYQKMIKDTDLDAVIVAASNTTHAEMTVAALLAGKHVLCEKPMATTLEDAQNMLDTTVATGKQLMIAHNQRLEKAHIKARDILRSGRLGKVLSFTSVFGHPGSENWAIEGENTWFYKREITGLGVLGDLAIHKLDLIRWLLEDDYSEAAAFLDTRHKTYPDGTPIDVEDNALCILRTKKGIPGTVIASWTYQKEENSTKIFCENGVMEIYVDPEFPLAIHYDNEQGEFYRLGKKSTNEEQLKSGIVDSFINALLSNVDVPITGIEGYKALDAVLTCQEAYRMQKVVKFNN